MLVTQTSNEERIVLEIINEKIKSFAVSMYVYIEEQIERSFTNIDKILQFAKGYRILIEADRNSRFKTWHDKITNSRGKLLEEYLSSRHFHIINVQSEMCTFQNGRGSSKIDVTITNNNIIADVHEWELREKGSCSEHNYFKYKIGKANKYKNKYNYQGIIYVVNEEK